jgi:hypothetical protein
MGHIYHARSDAVPVNVLQAWLLGRGPAEVETHIGTADVEIAQCAVDSQCGEQGAAGVLRPHLHAVKGGGAASVRTSAVGAVRRSATRGTE